MNPAEDVTELGPENEQIEDEAESFQDYEEATEVRNGVDGPATIVGNANDVEHSEEPSEEPSVLNEDVEESESFGTDGAARNVGSPTVVKPSSNAGSALDDNPSFLVRCLVLCSSSLF